MYRLIVIALLVATPLWQADARNGTVPGDTRVATPNAPSPNAEWDQQNTYWREQYPNRPYVMRKEGNYSEYEPAFKYGFEAYRHNPVHRYEDLDQVKMREGWEASRGNSPLNWDEAQPAARDAYNRMYQNAQPQPGQ